MERREQYDPEDIESLLNERSFDELLEEERAYVLRHLANRDEYETMRKLLHEVRNDARSEGAITAPPEVRAHVLDVFRQQQQPQWRVWLNSVGAMLWPKEMSALWRPALALGTMALLITASVFVFRQSDEHSAQLAELRPVKKETGVDGRNNAQPMEPAADSIRDGLLKNQLEQKEELSETEQPAAGVSAQNGYVQAAPPVQATDVAATERSSAAATGSTTGTFDLTTTTAAAASETLQEKSLVVEDERQADTAMPASVPHQVTEEELVRNESLANATVRTREVAKRKAEAYRDVSANSRSLGDDAALVSLINSGW